MFALTEFLLGERLKVFSLDPDEDQSDRPTIPVKLVCYHLDRFELLSNRFGSSTTCMPKCFWCVTRSYINIFFGDSTRDEKLPSVVMADDKGDLSEVDPKNIIMPSLEDLADDARQLYEKQKRIREQEELQMFITSFKKDQQGVMTQVKEITLHPVMDNKDKKVMTDKPNILDSDVANAIDGAVSASLHRRTNHYIFLMALHNQTKLLFSLRPN
jgi:hypothetical protein